MTAPAAWRPNSPPQEEFLAYGGFEGLYGGSAGGGKSEALLADALYGIEHPSYRAILFRRTFPELKKSLIDRAHDLYPAVGGVYNGADHVWTFRPTGAQIGFSHIQHEGDETRFDSAEFQYVGFDELTHFTRQQYIFLLSRLRSSKGIRPRIRGATNPGGVGHQWVFDRWRAWLDPRPEYEGPRARSGQPLWFVGGDDAVPDGRAVARGTRASLARTFVRARAEDNPAIDPQYLAQLSMLDRVTRAYKMAGDWLVKPGKGLYFHRDHWALLEELPPRAAWRKAVRAWDFAATPGGGDWTVGVLLIHCPTAIRPWIVADVVRLQGSPGVVKARVLATAQSDGKGVTVCVPQDPGQAGVDQAESYVAMLSGFTVCSRRPSKNKVLRASPASSQHEHRQFAMLRADWNLGFTNELHEFPEDSCDDQVDALADGFNTATGEVEPISPATATKLSQRARGLFRPR